MHGNGDAAIQAVLDAYARLGIDDPTGTASRRHRIEHCQLVSDPQLEQMASAGVLASFFIKHVHYWGDRHRDRFLGPERANRIDPLVAAGQHGIRFGLHSDTPVVPVAPLEGMWCAVARETRGGDVLGPGQRVDADVALRGYTSQAAHLGFEEHDKGTLEPGRFADVTVLSADPLTVTSDGLRAIEVDHTLVAGELVWSREGQQLGGSADRHDRTGALDGQPQERRDRAGGAGRRHPRGHAAARGHRRARARRAAAVRLGLRVVPAHVVVPVAGLADRRAALPRRGAVVMLPLVFFTVIGISVVIAFAARTGLKDKSIGEYLVGGRSFPAWLLYFLAVGEIYSIGTMIGLPSGIYVDGAAHGIWFLGYILMAYPLGYFIAPLIWRAGVRYDAMTIPDVFGRHFSSRTLELVTALAVLVALVPWGQYQFIGMQVVLGGLGLSITPTQAVLLAGGIAFLYLVVSGVRSPAFVAILKDAFMLSASWWSASRPCGRRAAPARSSRPATSPRTW